MSYQVDLNQYRGVVERNRPSSISKEEYERLVCSFLVSQLKVAVNHKLLTDSRFLGQSQKEYENWVAKNRRLKALGDRSFYDLAQGLTNCIRTWEHSGHKYFGFNSVDEFEDTGLRVIFLVKCIDFGTRYLSARHFFNREFGKFRSTAGSKLRRFIQQDLR